MEYAMPCQAPSQPFSPSSTKQHPPSSASIPKAIWGSRENAIQPIQSSPVNKISVAEQSSISIWHWSKWRRNCRVHWLQHRDGPCLWTSEIQLGVSGVRRGNGQATIWTDLRRVSGTDFTSVASADDDGAQGTGKAHPGEWTRKSGVGSSCHRR